MVFDLVMSILLIFLIKMGEITRIDKFLRALNLQKVRIT